MGVHFGCFDRKIAWVSIPGLPGGLIIHQGNPSISPKRTPMGSGCARRACTSPCPPCTPRASLSSSAALLDFTLIVFAFWSSNILRFNQQSMFFCRSRPKSGQAKKVASEMLRDLSNSRLSSRPNAKGNAWAKPERSAVFVSFLGHVAPA